MCAAGARTDNKTRRLLFFQFLAQFADLVLETLSGKFLRMHSYLLPGRGGTIIAPDQIDEIGTDAL